MVLLILLGPARHCVWLLGLYHLSTSILCGLAFQTRAMPHTITGDRPSNISVSVLITVTVRAGRS
jgi:hypothetical protein